MASDEEEEIEDGDEGLGLFPSHLILIYILIYLKLIDDCFCSSMLVP